MWSYMRVYMGIYAGTNKTCAYIPPRFDNLSRDNLSRFDKRTRPERSVFSRSPGRQGSGSGSPAKTMHIDSILTPKLASVFVQIAEHLSDSDVEESIRVLREGLRATQRVRGTGRIYEDVPDFKCRGFFLELLLRYKAIPPPSLKEVHILHTKDAGSQLPPADALRQLAAQGADLGALLGPWIESMPRAEPVPALGPADDGAEVPPP